MSLLFGRKTSKLTWSSFNYARCLVAGLYINSWLFTVMAAMLAQTNNNNQVSCTVSNFVCIFLYAGSKVFIYLFLVERAYIVTALGARRWTSGMFIFNVILLVPIPIIVGLALKFRVAEIDNLGYCRIGLQSPASGPLIGYDIIINVWLTAIFLRALISSTSSLQGPTKAKLRALARRTLMGTVLSLLLSTANIASIVFFDGHERGVVCLALCTMDVTLNAATIHWVTSPQNGVNSQTGESVPVEGGQPSKNDPIKLEKQVPESNSHVTVTIESHLDEYRNTYSASDSVLNRDF
ncbi:hypothetical protein BGX21_001141 [Mortierella sp. AD011]|nr:hypothetical protein BGX21_001141 [Mortierella sp. AD011]